MMDEKLPATPQGEVRREISDLHRDESWVADATPDEPDEPERPETD